MQGAHVAPGIPLCQVFPRQKDVGTSESSGGSGERRRTEEVEALLRVSGDQEGQRRVHYREWGRGLLKIH